MLEIGILKNLDCGTYKAGVQLAGSLTTYFDGINVAKNIPSSALVIGNYVILAIPGGNPKDACVIATWPQGSPGGGADGYSLIPLATPAPIRRHYTNAISTSPRTATVSSISGDVITLTANEAYRFWAAPGEADPPDGNMYLKIANRSKSPVQYAWVKASPADNQLQVTDSTDISGWSNGETISTDVDLPVSADIELDISPLIPDGAKAIWVKVMVEDSGPITTGKGTALSKEGASGTVLWGNPQVADIRLQTYPMTPIQANRHLHARDRACGTDTLKLFIVVLGYFI